MSITLAEMNRLCSVLYASVISDVLDQYASDYGPRAMRPFMRPLDDNMILFGRARTGYFAEAWSVEKDENPYELEIALLDDLHPGDVVVFACSGPTETIAPWGELLTTAAMQRGAVGCVTDGLVRDVRHVRAKQFPVFHGGIGPLDSKGRAKMVSMDKPVKCGGVLINSGDLIFGDVDGVVVIPRDIERSVIEMAEAKIQGENTTRDELLAGSLLKDVYNKYGVL